MFGLHISVPPLAGEGSAAPSRAPRGAGQCSRLRLPVAAGAVRPSAHRRRCVSAAAAAAAAAVPAVKGGTVTGTAEGEEGFAQGWCDKACARSAPKKEKMKRTEFVPGREVL